MLEIRFYQEKQFLGSINTQDSTQEGIRMAIVDYLENGYGNGAEPPNFLKDFEVRIK